MKILNNKTLHASVLFLLIILFVVFVFEPSVKNINTDFPNYYVSANMFLDGKDLISAYDNVEFNKMALMYGIENQFASFVPYPPVNALLMIPLAKLEPLTAKLLWNILNFTCFIFCAYFISNFTGLNFYLTAILFFISGYAFVNNFFFGQVYLIVLFFFSASIYFLLKDRDIVAAMLFSISVILKFYTIFFLILFLCRKKFKLVFASLIFIILLNVIIFSVTGWDLNMYYYSKIMPRISDGWVGTVYAAEFQSVTSLLHTFFYYEPSLNPNPLTESPQLYFIFKYIFYFGILISSVFAVLNSAKNTFLLQVSLFCFVCMLLLPVNASYQYVILIPAVAILLSHYSGIKDYRRIGVILILLFVMNSPVAIFLITVTKNKPYFFLGYVKLFILLYFWLVNIIILKNSGVNAVSVSSILRYSFIYAILVFIFSNMSLSMSYQKDDGSKNLLIDPGYLLTSPGAKEDKLIFTESRNDKFILKSNFGLKYDKENIFDPHFLNDNEIVYLTINDKKKHFKKLFISSLKDTVINNFSNDNSGQYSKDKSQKCFSKDGHIFLQNIQTNEIQQLTYGNSFNTLPVFADNDSRIIFCSDRNRGTGFTTLYELRIKN